MFVEIIELLYVKHVNRYQNLEICIIKNSPLVTIKRMSYLLFKTASTLSVFFFCSLFFNQVSQNVYPGFFFQNFIRFLTGGVKSFDSFYSKIHLKKTAIFGHWEVSKVFFSALNLHANLSFTFECL